MSRGKNIASVGLLFLSLGIAASLALGDDNSSKNQANWDKLKQLSAGQEIQMRQNDAKSSNGDFRSVTDEAIVMNTAGGEQTISRQSVLRISTKGQRHRTRNALIGAGIGAGAGLVWGAARGNGTCTQFCIGPIIPKSEVIGVVTGVGAIVGAIVGAVIPTGGWHEIYRAR